ncbi:hypothetical protein DV736_g1835, partial [Chaetothyriales sp. CBS 134916]
MAESMAYGNEKRVTIIGIYGLPGTGKSHMLRGLERILGSDYFTFFEGSEVIGRLVPGGLEAFKKLQEHDKIPFREHAISSIAADCINDRKAGVITGHYMFWSEADDWGASVCTQRDLTTYTHVIYLDTPPEVIAARCRDDSTKIRPSLLVEQLQRWQNREKAELRKACYQNRILFSVVNSESVEATDLAMILQHFRNYDQTQNLRHALQKLDNFIETQGEQVKAMLALDGDRTMAAEDTGTLLWENVRNRYKLQAEDDPFKSIFGSPLGYSHKAFCQATLLLEEWADFQTFEEICTEVAAKVTLYPEIASLLHQVGAEQQASAVVITCGVRLIWQKVLEMAGVADKVKVIGGGRISEGLVVDAAVKGVLVDHMRHHHQLFVTALGDSVLDLPMLCKANQAVVVVGNEQTRSKTMDADLALWINTTGPRARQTLLGPNATPRLDSKRLPVVQLTDPSFVDLIFSRPHVSSDLDVILLTDSKASKLLMSPMRDAMKNGPSLRDAHYNTGWYLAVNALVDAIGIEEYQIRHVQGGQSSGYRLARENGTLIVALMRGGEPMALGVNNAFPLASFLHAKEPEDIKAEHLGGKATVLLVDSVINSGKTMIDFTHHVHSLGPNVRILMVAGVVQAQAVGKLKDLQETIRHRQIGLVALRKSDNRYTGKGSTDTGNRLFNTTYLQ